MNKPFNERGTQEITKMQIGDYALHGDVILCRIENMPAEFDTMKQEENDALAYGEFTGHLHKLFRMAEDGSTAFSLRESTTGEKFLKVFEHTILKHQEHSPIIVPPGCYKIGIQTEYDPFTKRARAVQD